MFSTRINEMLRTQLVANGTADEKVNRIVSKLTVAELKEIAYPVLLEAYKARERHAETVQAHTKVEKRLAIVGGKKVEVEVEVTPDLDFKPMIVPRDAAGQLRRQETRSVEQKALAAARRASTREQRLASFVFLKSETVSVGGELVPWHELTLSQMETRRRALAKTAEGLRESQELLDIAARTCREFGVETLAEAEAAERPAAA